MFYHSIISLSLSQGLFRASLSGEAGEWHDSEFIGKRWELSNLYNNHGQGDWATVVGRSMQQLTASNSIRNPSDAYTYATAPANNATTLANSGMLPAYGLIQDWGQIGGRPTNDPATVIAAGGLASPIVLPEIRLGNEIYWFRENYKTVQKARREAKFGELVQGNMPVDAYYREITKIGKLLKYPEQHIENQFFRGLNDENLLEAERQDDKPLASLVKSLKKIEERKAEMRYGVAKRNVQSELQQRNIVPVQAPSIVSSQEPNILKPVTSHAITQDMLDKLLQSHTDNLTKSFQTQLQALQDTIARPQQKKIAPPIPPKDYRKIHEWYAHNDNNPFDDNTTYNIEDIMGENYYRPDKKSLELAQAISKASAKAKKARMERQVDKLANALGGLNIDSDNAMDVDLADGSIILQDADGNEFTAYVTRGLKKK